MPWTWQRYPDAMKNLPVRVRHKAIEIANALLDEGYEEGRAIAIGISQAREWVENNPPRQRKAQDSKGANGSGSKTRAKREPSTQKER